MSVSFCPAGKSSSTAAGTSIVLPEPGGAVTTTAPLREAATIRAGTKMIFPLPRIEIVTADNLDEHLQHAEMTPERLERILGL